ncbi:MAG TPA: toll/interleukin-1 receptor domain-containing protein [Mycobacteriales bacterium]|jgi:hypothetical protein
MDAAERAIALRAIVDQLARGEWVDANTVLAAFRFPTMAQDAEPWGSTPTLKAYVLGVISDADDETIRALHAYVTGFDGNRADPGCWAPGRLRLFASYLDAHRAEVGAVRARVALAGVDMFAAHDSIDVSKEWQQVIEDALRSSDAAVVFLHDGFRDSAWTDQEVGYCLDRRLPILPVKYAANPHGFLARYQAADCAGLAPDHIADLILAWLCAEPRTQAAMAEATVTALAASNSFDQTRLIVGLLNRLPAFTADQLRRLDAATADNTQVSLARYAGTEVPTLLARLVAERSAPRP